MDSVTLPASYRLGGGGTIDLSPLPLADRVLVAWLQVRVRGGESYASMRSSLLSPGSYVLQGRGEVGGDLRDGRLMQVLDDMLEQAATREGVEHLPADADAYSSVTEAAQALGISRAAVAHAIRDGRLYAHRAG